jgi:hypothetical protein
LEQKISTVSHSRNCWVLFHINFSPHEKKPGDSIKNTSYSPDTLVFLMRVSVYYQDYEAITHFQKGLRYNMDIFSGILRGRFDVRTPENMRENFPVFHNFLPREYMSYGTAISPENRGKETSYIAQQYIGGNPLSAKENRRLLSSGIISDIPPVHPDTHILHPDWKNSRHQTNQWSKTLVTMVSAYRKHICDAVRRYKNGGYSMALEYRWKSHQTRHHHTRTDTPERDKGDKKNR